MLDLVRLIWALVIDLFLSKAALEAEVLVLRQQIVVLRRGRRTRPPMQAIDRLVLGSVCWLVPNARDALAVVRPGNGPALARGRFPIVLALEIETSAGRPAVAAEIRELIRDMSLANPLWGPRGSTANCSSSASSRTTSVAKYMARRRRPTVPAWKTFIRNHADGIAAMDLFVVPTVSFRLLFRAADPSA